MIRRTTLAAEDDDLAVLEREASQRKTSLSQVLREVVHEAAKERRARRPQPRFGLFAGSGTGVAQQAADDEGSPAQGRMRS